MAGAGFDYAVLPMGCDEIGIAGAVQGETQGGGFERAENLYERAPVSAPMMMLRMCQRRSPEKLPLLAVYCSVK